ncbi:MAG: hypothetical protein ACYCWW_13305 [Deltaproteobacteria bacterium]
MGDTHLHGELDASSLPVDELVAALRAGGHGFYSSEAALELVVTHGLWLRRPDFRRFVGVTLRLDGTGVLASIDWPAVLDADLPCSESEASILRLACEVAGVPTDSSLQELVNGLDETNIVLALRAILHAARGAGATPVLVAPWPIEDLES